LAILEVCGPTGSVTKKDYLARELFYIDWALKQYGKKVYNILKVPQSSLGYKHNEESKRKMSELKAGSNNPMFGKEKSAEFIFHQKKDKSGANNPQFGVVKSEKTLAKLRRMVYVYDLNDNSKFLGGYATVEFTRVFKISSSTLYKVLKKDGVHKGLLLSRELLNNKD
jgi:group I intron endonuclease